MPKCDFVQFWKFLVGLFAILEVPHGIVHIWEFHMGLCTFWKFLMGFCALFEVICEKSYHIKMIWLSPNEGHLLQTNVTIRLLRINLGRVTRIFVITGWGFELVAVAKHTRVHFILSCFLCRIRVFATCILIDCGYRWPQPVQSLIL
jgi:hypothetical protein